MYEYQNQASQQTLAEGIAEYFAANEKHFGARKMTPDAQEFFRCHDTAHVVFGCDISLDEEAIVKLCSMFGTTIGVRVLRGYRLAESKEVYTELSVIDILRTFVTSFVLVPQTLWRCTRMHKRWVWDNHDAYLPMPLEKLRLEFGVRVAH